MPDRETAEQTDYGLRYQALHAMAVDDGHDAETTGSHLGDSRM